jgi:hypothetical protein
MYKSHPLATAPRATALGYQRLTHPYYQGEEWMLDSVIADLVRGRCTFLLVQEYAGLAVFRK